jgi:hypothetical protein
MKKKNQTDSEKLKVAIAALEKIYKETQNTDINPYERMGYIRHQTAYCLFKLGKPEHYTELNKQLTLPITNVKPGHDY